jgi:disulfide bond formation protein DsbB
VALGGVLWPAGRLLWSMLIGLLALLGMGVASYQTWMQAFPHLATECSYTDPNLIERLVDWLGMQWPSLFLATGFCTSKEWVFLGLSMANWSLVVFAGIAGLAALIFLRRL